MAIETVVRKYRLGEEPVDVVVWKNFSHTERLDALESIRQEYHQSRYGTEPRLQRVLRITQQASR